MGNMQNYTDYTHNRVIIKRRGGRDRVQGRVIHMRAGQGSREGYSHGGGGFKGGGDRVQGRVIHTRS